jgi:hypothetical protein
LRFTGPDQAVRVALMEYAACKQSSTRHRCLLCVHLMTFHFSCFQRSAKVSEPAPANKEPGTNKTRPAFCPPLKCTRSHARICRVYRNVGVAPPRRLYVPERVSVCFAAARAAYNEEVMDGSTYHSAEEASRRTGEIDLTRPRSDQLTQKSFSELALSRGHAVEGAQFTYDSRRKCSGHPTPHKVRPAPRDRPRL